LEFDVLDVEQQQFLSTQRRKELLTGLPLVVDYASLKKDWRLSLSFPSGVE
jgi:hypothetical protein